MLTNEKDNLSLIQTKKEDGTNKGYWKGKKRSQETKDKIRVSLKGRSVSPKTEFKKLIAFV